MLIFCISWYLIGILIIIGMLYLDWRKGQDIDYNAIIAILVMGLLGPFLPVAILTALAGSKLSKINFDLNKVIIKGKDKK